MHISASEYLPFRLGFVLMVDRPNTLSIDAPTFTLGLGNARTTGRRPRTCRLAPMEAATAPARSALTWQRPLARVLAPQRSRPLDRKVPHWCLHARLANVKSGLMQALTISSAIALEKQFAEIAESQPELLARHYTEAGLIEKARQMCLCADVVTPT